MTSPTPPAEPQFADRTYRSTSALVCGVLLLVLVAVMAGDALLRGEGQAPWLALAALLTAVPLIVAFTLRPAVFVNDERIRIRNPFRTIQLPWTEVADVRAGYSSELIAAGGTKYQLWAVPVSLRDRKRASRAAGRAPHKDAYGRFSPGAGAGSDAHRHSAPPIAAADQTIVELRGLAEKAGEAAAGTTTGTVRWAYEVIAPAVVGVVLFAVLVAIG
ncbi:MULTISPECIES: PH domain-containing protein [unclassified Streptomyces]|uniref:PH domain-containing protein n=1 Tax=unclassified Streptomyces TaxID=2593676 RepID=UPI00081D6924|nr:MULTISPECIES: PH domain-containing protein [unclassified Streptomyces]MYR95192.1 PH domain-containing protein [Streptomyces sp. SID4937]SCD85621.1 PH domain-containing protein [Streptomyces sp. ScaeMP-e83]